ncbi:MAG: aminotransferase class V-fold PLP-dependent enzyme [Acidobacteria bacterium]|nr:aminotransferase class V-fold PLP-dependent enzyme [Acidobacteriota bacterium]
MTRYPDYRATALLDELRATEYARLDEQGHVYLDYTGGCLYARSQVERHLKLIAGAVLGNPHSANPTSAHMTSLVESARKAALAYFGAAEDYALVFTLNASGALKLVGESFPFGPGGEFLASADNHNSVNGIREFARAKGARARYAPVVAPALRLDVAEAKRMLDDAGGGEKLFAFPAQSNFTGVKHPLELVEEARQRGWRVLLDAAAYAPTNRLDLRQVRPDFVTLSFYKMFGYPTGVGALLVRRESLRLLRRPWFAGGTVNFASVGAMAHVLARNEAAFEDGTLNYLSIPAVEIGLRHLEAVGIGLIGTRVQCLTGWLVEELLALRHSNGRAMVRLYGPSNTEDRGGTVTMNLYDPAGHLLDYRRVEELAGEAGISLRTGCFCNPGAGECAEGLTGDDMRAAYALGDDINLQSFLRLMQESGQNKSAGAIRASIGLASNWEDSRRFVEFVESFRDQTRLAIGEVTFDIESCRVIRDGS